MYKNHLAEKKEKENKLNHAGTSEGARHVLGEGIGEILPRSDVLG